MDAKIAKTAASRRFLVVSGLTADFLVSVQRRLLIIVFGILVFPAAS